MPTVSVVIPTWRRPRLVVRALRAVLDDPATTEAIVVIDGHDPGSELALADHTRADARVRVVRTEGSSGEPRGEQPVRDFGASLAKSDVILALDDDIVADPGLVSGHARHHAEAADLVVLGYVPVAPPPPGDRWSAATRLYAEWYEAACDGLEADDDSILAGMWGGNFSVRREHWLRASALEPVDVGFMHTDREFGLRLRDLGLRGTFDRQLRAVHHDQRDVVRLVDAARGSAIATANLEAAHPDLEPAQTRSHSKQTVVRMVPKHVWSAGMGVLVRASRAANRANLDRTEYSLVRLAYRLTFLREFAARSGR